MLDAAGSSSEQTTANRAQAWLQSEVPSHSKTDCVVAQLVALWCDEDGVTLISSKADKHSILQKASVTCGIRTEAGQRSKAVDQSQSLQRSPELKISDQL